MAQAQTVDTWEIATVEFFLPPHKKEEVVGELVSQGRKGVSFVLGGIEWWIYIVVSQLWTSFNLHVKCWEALALAAGFVMAPNPQTYLIAVVAGLVGLTLRDAHMHPKIGDPIAQGHDTMVGLMFLVGVEAFEWVFAPAYGLPLKNLLEGCLLSLLTVSMVRAIMRRPKNAAAFGASSFKLTRSTTLLWLGAAILGKLLSPMPELFVWQDNLYNFLPIACFAVARALQRTDFYNRVIVRYPIIRPDDPREELKSMIKWLWTPKKVEGQNVASHLFIEFSAFGFYGLPMTATLLAWKAGIIPTIKMDWTALLISIIAFVAMTMLWIPVRLANKNMLAAAVKAATPRAMSRRIFRKLPPVYPQLLTWIQLRNLQEPSPIALIGTRYTFKCFASGFQLPMSLIQGTLERLQKERAPANPASVPATPARRDWRQTFFRIVKDHGLKDATTLHDSDSKQRCGRRST